MAHLGLVTVMIADYDEALAFYVGRLGFVLVEDTQLDASKDFAADHGRLLAAGVRFVEEPRSERYGTVVVFEDLYGNRWDMLERRWSIRPPE